MGIQIVEFRPSGDQTWVQRAECAKPGSPGMFPHEKDAVGVEVAKKVCTGCPIRTECLAAALERSEQYGVWGGLTVDERNALRRRNVRVALRTGSERQSFADLAREALRTRMDNAS